MKRKNILRTMLSLLMTVVVVFSTFGANIALAATVVGETKTTEYTLSDWGYDFQGSGLPDAYDPLSGKSDNDQFSYQWANDFYYWKDSSGRISYCVQLGAKHVDSVTMDQIQLNEDEKKYYPETLQRNYLNYATIYAYKGTTKYGYTWKEELVASQCLIWAISGKYFDSSTTSLGTNETKLLNCIKAPSTSAKNNMIACYKKMKADVLSHRTIAGKMYDTKLKAEDNSYTLKYNSSTNRWECTVPSNRYLSHFKTPTVSGVTFTRSGNNLKVSASTYQALLRLEKAGALEFTKIRNVNSKTIEACTPVFLTAKTSTVSSQAKVSYVQGSDPVEGYMAFEGDYGSVTITKTASDANGKTYTATSTANKALNSAVRFKLKASNGNWVNATRDASGKYTYTRHDSTATGTAFALNANGKFTVAGLPAGKYTLIETTTASGYTKAANKTFTVTDGNATSTSVVNKQANGDLEITKKITVNGITSSISTADNWSDIKSGIRFVLTDSKGNYVDCTGSDGSYTYTGTRTNAQQLSLSSAGKLFVSDLPSGKYTITEVTVSGVTFEELRLRQPSAVSVTISGGETVSKTIVNSGYGTKEIHIVKNIIPYDDEVDITEEMWQKIYFYMSYHSSDGNIKYATVKLIDSKNGIYEFVEGIASEDSSTHIYLGTESHTATIINIPEEEFSSIEWVIIRESALGYVGDHAQWSVFFDGELSGTVTVNNTESSGKLQVTKRTEGNLNLSGIKFILTGTSYAGRDVFLTAVTDENGIATFDKVPSGYLYTITENGDTVPTAYLTASEQTVKVEYAKTTPVTFENKEKTGAIRVTKATVGSLNLEGIEFILSGTSDSGRAIELKATTNENGIANFTGVPIGTYVVKENGDTVPTAYLTASEQTVKVEYAKTTPVTFTNTEKTGSIQVTKATVGSLNLEGIEFILSGTSDSGRAIELKATTNENGIANFTGVPIGTYVVKENGETVPTAYLTASEQTVKVEYAKTTPVTFENEEKYGEVIVQKRTEGMLNIEGIGFTLSGTSDSGREIKVYDKTDKDGKISFVVPIGSYIITEDESTVPYAYLVAEPQKVTVTYSEQVTRDFYNAEKTGEIQLTKSTFGGDDIANIGFILSGISDSGREISQEVTTDENGKAMFEAVPIGTYTITEKSETLPFGYFMAAPQTVTVEYAATSTADVFNTGEGTFELTKSDVSNGKLIPNCEIAIYDTDGNVVVSGKTDKDGVVKFTLPEGTYYYQEIEAPDGYLIDTNKYEFTVSAGEITKASMTNERIPSAPSTPQTGLSEPDPEFGDFILPGITIAIAVSLIFFRKRSNKN